jgi:hypothetical protein
LRQGWRRVVKLTAKAAGRRLWSGKRTGGGWS